MREQRVKIRLAHAIDGFFVGPRERSVFELVTLIAKRAWTDFRRKSESMPRDDHWLPPSLSRCKAAQSSGYILASVPRSGGRGGTIMAKITRAIASSIIVETINSSMVRTPLFPRRIERPKALSL